MHATQYDEYTIRQSFFADYVELCWTPSFVGAARCLEIFWDQTAHPRRCHKPAFPVYLDGIGKQAASQRCSYSEGYRAITLQLKLSGSLCWTCATRMPRVSSALLVCCFVCHGINWPNICWKNVKCASEVCNYLEKKC